MPNRHDLDAVAPDTPVVLERVWNKLVVNTAALRALGIDENTPDPPADMIYAGSFDPITRGHDDLIRRSLEFVDRLVVAVAMNSAKQPIFTPDERVKLIQASVGEDPRVEVRQFHGLLVDFARTEDPRAHR